MRHPAFAILTLMFSALMLCGAGRLNVPSRHYTVYGDLDAHRARAIAAHMDAMFDEYARRFSAFPRPAIERCGLYLFSSERAYLEHLRGRDIDATNSAGIFFFDGDETGLATFVDDQSERRMLHILQHEGFHQFAFLAIGPDLPIWANEGIAEYFGESIFVKGGLRTGVAPQGRVAAIRQRVERGETLDFQTMISLTDAQWSQMVTGGDVRAGLLYDQAWAMIYFLVQGHGGRYADLLMAYLKEVAAGTAPASAFRVAFRSSPEDVERAWRNFVINEWEADPVGTAADRLEFIAEGIIVFAEHEGRAPVSIVQLQSWLRQRSFVVTRHQHGAFRRTNANEDENFEAPRVHGGPRGRQPAIELLRPARGTMLPRLRVTGLPVTIEVEWVHAPRERPRYEIRFH